MSPPAAGTQKTVHDYMNMPDLPTIDPLQKAHHLLIIDPENMIEFQSVQEHNDFLHKAKVIEKMEEPGKFLVAIGDGDREEIMEYNEIMNFVEDQISNEEDDQAWTFEAILDHRKNKNGQYDLLIKWAIGEETWEPLSSIADQTQFQLLCISKMQKCSIHPVGSIIRSA